MHSIEEKFTPAGDGPFAIGRTMGDKLPWFKFFAKDWLTDDTVLEMDCAERGMYIQLLAYQWVNGKIPKTRVAIARLVGCLEAEVSDIVVDAFPNRVNPKLNERRHEAMERFETLSDAGRRGGKKTQASRKGGLKGGLAEASSLDKQIQIQKQSQMQNIKNSDGAEAPTFGDYMALFREVWRSTPEEQTTNGSILKQYFRKGKPSPELEAAIRGLPLVLKDGQRPSMKWLYAKGCATDMFARSVQEYYQSIKEKPEPKHNTGAWVETKTKDSPQPLDFGKYTNEES